MRVPSTDNDKLYCTAIVINSYSENISVFIACFILDEAGAVFISRLPQLNGVLPGCECIDLCVYFYLLPAAYCLCIMLSSNVYPPFCEVMMSRKRNTSKNRGKK